MWSLVTAASRESQGTQAPAWLLTWVLPVPGHRQPLHRWPPAFFKMFFNVDCFFFFFNSSLNLLQRCFCVMLWFFGHKSCEILAPQLGIKPSPPTLESEVITPGLPEQSLAYSLDCLLPTSLAIFCLVNSYSSFRTRFPGPSDGALCSGAGPSTTCPEAQSCFPAHTCRRAPSWVPCSPTSWPDRGWQVPVLG